MDGRRTRPTAEAALPSCPNRVPNSARAWISSEFVSPTTANAHAHSATETTPRIRCTTMKPASWSPPKAMSAPRTTQTTEFHARLSPTRLLSSRREPPARPRQATTATAPAGTRKDRLNTITAISAVPWRSSSARALRIRVPHTNPLHRTAATMTANRRGLTAQQYPDRSGREHTHRAGAVCSARRPANLTDQSRAPRRPRNTRVPTPPTGRGPG